MNITKLSHLTGHEGAIYCLAYNDQNRFFSGGFDNYVVEWNIDEPNTAKACAKLNSKAISLLFLKERNWLLAGQSTGGVHVIDLNKSKEINLLQAHNDMVFALFFDENCDRLFVGAGDGKISVWNLDSMQCEKLVKFNFGKIREIRKHFGLYYVGTESGSILIVNRELQEIKLISEHLKNFSVNAIRFYGQKMLTGSRDGHLNEYIWIDSNFEILQKIPAHNYAIYSISESPCGNFIATASRDKSVKIWKSFDLTFLKKIDFKEMTGHVGSVNDIIWFKNYIVSVSDDRSIIIWDVDLT
ncbi:MAG: WD40 repeat domain-containing protein [Crocinitomicaceae bacterium]